MLLKKKSASGLHPSLGSPCVPPGRALGGANTHTPGWVLLFRSPQRAISQAGAANGAYDVWRTYHRYPPGEPESRVEEIRVSVASSECRSVRLLHLSEHNSLRGCRASCGGTWAQQLIHLRSCSSDTAYGSARWDMSAWRNGGDG